MSNSAPRCIVRVDPQSGATLAQSRCPDGVWAYAHFLRAKGDRSGAQAWTAKAERLKRVFNDTWYGAVAGRYLVGFDHPQRRPVSAFGYETSWFIPYTGRCEPGPRATAYLDFIHNSFQAKPSPNIEAWTYLPDVFHAWSQNERGWRYFKHVLDSRSSYPEVSFTVISHIATRIMRMEPDAHGRSVSTLGRLPAARPVSEVRRSEWTERQR